MKQLDISPITAHSQDQAADFLYEPLRHALTTQQPLVFSRSKVEESRDSNNLDPTHNAFQSRMQSSRMVQESSKMDHQNLRQCTFIPIRKKLVQTHDQEVNRRVRSRSYRAISVEEKVGKAIRVSQADSIPGSGTLLKEVVYEYEKTPMGTPRGSQVTKKTMARSNIPANMLPPRSGNRPKIPVSPKNQPIEKQFNFNRVERVESEQINHKPFIQLPSEELIRRERENETQSRRIIQQPPTIKKTESYVDIKMDYNNSKKSSEVSKGTVNNYSFKSRELKLSNSRNQQPQKYKYNLFSVIDEHINSGCAQGCSSSNEIIPPKQKNGWRG